MAMDTMTNIRQNIKNLSFKSKLTLHQACQKKKKQIWQIFPKRKHLFFMVLEQNVFSFPIGISKHNSIDSWIYSKPPL
jgi:hypothetical protein